MATKQGGSQSSRVLFAIIALVNIAVLETKTSTCKFLRDISEPNHNGEFYVVGVNLNKK